MAQEREIALFIDPFSYHFLGDKVFEPSFEKFNGENILAPWVYLRDWFNTRGVQVHTADYLSEGKFCKKKNVFISFGMRKHCQAAARRSDAVLSAFFAFESPTVEPRMYRGLGNVQRWFKRVFTFCDADSLRPFLAAPLKSEIFQIPSPLDSEREDLWSRRNRKFLVMINHNRLPANRYNELYTERMRAIEFFARTGEIDLYGRGWNVPSFKPYSLPVPGTLQHAHRFLIQQWQRIRPVPALQAARRVWKGPIPSKLEGLSRYNFSICFDNVVLNGWITEKIFDCFATGNIPVYRGAPDIERHVPPECFIDMRKFANYEELRRYLKSLSPEEIQECRENGRAYLRSEKFKPFTKQAFTERLARVIEEDTGVRF